MVNPQFICEQFASIVNGKAKYEHGVCTVQMHRTFQVTVQGKPSTSILSANISFESLDQNGNALNLGEFAVLQEEVYPFMTSLVQQGIIVSGLHNHWLYTRPAVLYLHTQSIEPPLHYAQKIARSFSYLLSKPTS